MLLLTMFLKLHQNIEPSKEFSYWLKKDVKSNFYQTELVEILLCKTASKRFGAQFTLRVISTA